MNKGLTKENVKKMITFEGFKKEIPWILFCISIILVSYGYYDLKDKYEGLREGDCTGRCIWDCEIPEVINRLEEENPTATISCDYETKQCLISGGYVPYLTDFIEANWTVSPSNESE